MKSLLLVLASLFAMQTNAGTLEILDASSKGTIMSAEINEEGDVRLIALIDNKTSIQCLASVNELKLRNMSSSDFVMLAMNLHSTVVCEPLRNSKAPRIKKIFLGSLTKN